MWAAAVLHQARLAIRLIVASPLAQGGSGDGAAAAHQPRISGLGIKLNPRETRLR